MKEILKKLMPPFILNILNRLRWGKCGFYGDFSSWADAHSKCSGYSSPEIFRKCSESALKVKRGEAVCERDSVLFDRPPLSVPLIAGLLALSLGKDEKSVTVLDFGGSFGSSYYQCRHLLKDAGVLKWAVVEQKHFADFGKTNLEDGKLSFYDELDAALHEINPDLILLSSVIQYIEDPISLLYKISSLSAQYVVIDRTPVAFDGKRRIAIQHVHPSIYDGAYPVWIFNEDDLLDPFKEKFDTIGEYMNEGGCFTLKSPPGQLREMGYIFEKRKK